MPLIIDQSRCYCICIKKYEDQKKATRKYCVHNLWINNVVIILTIDITHTDDLSYTNNHKIVTPSIPINQR